MSRNVFAGAAMSSFVQEIETAVMRLVTEPAFTAFAGSEAGILVWSAGGDRILWSSPAAEPLKNALLHGGDGPAALPDADAVRLRILADGAAPRQGMQLERLRLNPLRYAAPLTCACRLVTIPGHGEVLVTAIAGQVPLAPAVVPPQQSAEKTAPAAPANRAKELREKRTIRFVWQADADLRITAVSPAFADAVGPRSAAIVGREWPELLAASNEEKPGAIAGHLAARETWSGEILFWPIDGSDHEVGIELAGLPVFDAQRLFMGYRGFGLCRGDLVRQSERAMPVAESVPEQIVEWESGRQEPESAPGSGEAAGQSAELPEVEGNLTEADKLSLREIARALGGRIGGGDRRSGRNSGNAPKAPPLAEPKPESHARPEQAQHAPPSRQSAETGSSTSQERLLDLLPAGVLVHRGEEVLFANRVLLNMIGYANVDKLATLGVVGLFRDSPVLAGGGRVEQPFMLTSAGGDRIAVDVRLSSLDWKDVPASLMLIRQSADTGIVEQLRRAERDSHERGERIRELESILATATDGILTLDETGRILSLNSSGEALFGYDAREVIGEAVTVLMAPESHMVALDYLDGLRLTGVAGLLEGGREVVGRVKQGGSIPLFMTIGRISDGPKRKLCAVLRDITAFKKAENELLAAKRAAEEASEQKSDLLAKISHEIRTPLNAIIGFAEVMVEERFGPVGNDRYKSYLKDMHTSGSHVMSLVNDLLDLAKIEAGHMELSFSGVHLNDLVSSCVGMMQQQASRDRIVMRTSFAAKLPSVVADERSVRQIVLNLLSNAIKFTDAGGQVIVSTAMADDGSVAIRVRDTGIGMDENDIAAALEPFRQLATARQRGGTGLGLPLTKALIEANRGTFEISSARNEGTLVEVIFPPTRVLAE